MRWAMHEAGIVIVAGLALACLLLLGHRGTVFARGDYPGGPLLECRPAGVPPLLLCHPRPSRVDTRDTSINTGEDTGDPQDVSR